MSEVHALYQRIIVEHNRQPRNCGPLPGASRVAEARNAFCGDRVSVYVSVNDAGLSAATFEAVGCALATASASLMTVAVAGCTFAEVRALAARFRAMLAEPSGSSVDGGLGDLAAFAGVREYPSRITCATLAWDALESALMH